MVKHISSYVISNYVISRLDQFKNRGPMYGSNEALELCAIQLLELEHLTKYPDILSSNPRFVLDIYNSELRKKYPKSPPAPLFICSDNFYNDLYDFCIFIRTKIGTDS